MAHLTEDDLVLYRYQESPDAAAVARHLAECQQCQAEYESLGRMLNSFDLHVPEPPASYERDVWTRVQARLELRSNAEQTEGDGRTTSARPLELRSNAEQTEGDGRTTSARPLELPAAPVVVTMPAARAARTPKGFGLTGLWPQLALAASIALLLAATFAIDRAVRPGTSGEPATEVAGQAAGSSARDRVLLTAVGEHLQRSELMLTEFNNAEARRGASRIDLSEQAAWAEDLVSENRLYRQSAAGVGDVQVLSLLEDLERVLLEVAHGPASANAQELDRLRTRLDTQDVLFKVRVAGAGLRAREDVAAVVDASPDVVGSGL